MRYKRVKSIFLFYIITIASSGCTWKKADSLPACNVDAKATVSFQKNILPIFQRNCAVPDCHSGSNPEGNLNLEKEFAYERITRKGSGYVDTVNPYRSVIFSSLVSKSNPMPPDRPLSQCTIDSIILWMRQGARNN